MITIRSNAPLPDVRGDVTFERVSFAYVSGQPVLHEVSFIAPAGTTTALVGSSGSGKSTTLSLLMAFARKPDSGCRILIDGQDLAATMRYARLSVAPRRRHAGQFPVRWHRAKDNIAFAKPGATDAEVRYGREDRALR